MIDCCVCEVREIILDVYEELTGHCYQASVAVSWLLRDISGIEVVWGKYEDHDHCWLSNNGVIIDPTVEQFLDRSNTVDPTAYYAYHPVSSFRCLAIPSTGSLAQIRASCLSGTRNQGWSREENHDFLEQLLILDRQIRSARNSLACISECLS